MITRQTDRTNAPIRRMRGLASLLAMAILLLASVAAAAAQPGQTVQLGDFRLESGEVIREGHLAYVALGTLNPAKDNVLVVPVWLAGTPRELVDIGFIGPGQVFDTSRYYVVAIDSFGSGVSSSPSNSRLQPGGSFPAFSIRDVVRAQHTLLTEHLGIRHVRAVAGISMGALATFQWMVSYPAFMDMAIPIEGSPRLTAYDRLVWSTELAVLENVRTCKGNRAAMEALTPLHVLLAWPPEYRIAHTRPDEFPAFLADQRQKLSAYDADNWASQVRAILGHDIFRDFGQSEEKAARTIRAKGLVVTVPGDRMAYPEPSRAFARLLGAETAELDGACGHFAFLCDRKRLADVVNAFLSQAHAPRQRGR